MDSKKTALVLHGWPQHKIPNYFLVRHLENKGYSVLVPDLFDQKTDFQITNLKNVVKDCLNSLKPDVIIGISLGGVVLPYIATDFGNSKLIFISTGTKFRPKPKLFNIFIRLSKHRSLQILSGWILKLPVSFISLLYRTADPFIGPEESRKKYLEDMTTNIRFIKGIPVSKELQIVNFAIKTENSEILKSIDNQSLIFAGEHDLLMPKEEGERLHKLLKNSYLVVNDGEHFDVITDKDLSTVDKFLEY